MRSLGAPVVKINVAPEQIHDRVDEALRFFSEFHFEGVERIYLKYQITQDDIDRKYISLVPSNTGLTGEDASMTITETGATGGVGIDTLITSIVRCFHINDAHINMFDIRYQYALNDLYTFGTIDLVQYDMTQSYLTLLQEYLSPETIVEFKRSTNRIYLSIDWQNKVRPGQYIVFECFRIMDPRVYPEVYEDRMLKKYLTALIKRQWGINLSKYSGIKLPGDISFNGDKMLTDANSEIEKIEQEIKGSYNEPPNFFMG